MRERLLCFFALLVLRALDVGAWKARSIDYDALEKAWEQGDSEMELKTAFDEHEELVRDNKGNAKELGPQMVFVTLKDNVVNSKDDVAALAGRWKDMLFNGGVEASIYDIEPNKLLVGLQRGKRMSEVHQFLREQGEVLEYEWDGQTFHAQKDREQHRKSPSRKKDRQAYKKKRKTNKGTKSNGKAHRKGPQSKHGVVGQKEEL